jgi:hypothetical protein
MKKILFAVAILACSLVPAHAESMPKIYTGKWCYVGVEGDLFDEYKKSKDGTCPRQAYVIEFRLRYADYVIHAAEHACKFVSIKQTKNEKLGKIIINTVARCSGEGDNNNWTEKRAFFYDGNSIWTREVE